jgi:mono/diheme cytochrome c family protein
VKTFPHSVALLLLSCAIAAYPQTAPSEGSLTANPVYQKNCAKCHGKTAEGRHFGGPSLVSEETTSKSAEDLRKMITDGKGHMPKYAGKLTPQEINTLVEHIKAAKAK